MRFLVIEGLDGSGKSTQVELLCKHLEKKSIEFKFLHFPRLEVGIYGKLVARFLRGEMGSNEHVDPYLVALIFAGDRKDAKAEMEQWMKEDQLVIVDRYVYSNIAFQCAKYSHTSEQTNLARWIMDLEYNVHQLPVPDMNIFLDVPFHFTKERLSMDRVGEDRSYLKGSRDIHEADLEFQEKVRGIYHSVCSKLGNLTMVNCANESGAMRSPEDIFENLKEVIGV
ncbi:MAG: dTMP kinase [Bacteroidales bacterium]